MLLSLAIFLPIIGAVLVLFLPKESKGLIRAVALLASVAALVPIAIIGVDYLHPKGEAAPEALAKLAEARVASIADAAMQAEARNLLKDPIANAPGKLTDAK